MIYVGLDGYRKGWVAVRVDGETHELCFYSTIAELLATKFDVAAIDMPIGLPERGERACDLAARKCSSRMRRASSPARGAACGILRRMPRRTAR